jgi:hypothetical protein
MHLSKARRSVVVVRETVAMRVLTAASSRSPTVVRRGPRHARSPDLSTNATEASGIVVCENRAGKRVFRPPSPSQSSDQKQVCSPSPIATPEIARYSGISFSR